MFKKAAVVLALGMAFSGTALAEAWTFNYAAANTAEGYVPPPGPLAVAQSALIDELKFTAESMVVFTGGTPFQAGSTFTDYIALRIDTANYLGNPVNDPINAVFNPDRQITVVLQASGSFGTGGAYNFSPAGFTFNVFYDAGATPATFTFANFGPSMLAFADGTNVENASLITGGGTSTNQIIPDGTVAMLVLMNSLLNGGFELFNGQDPTQLIFGISDSNNNLCTADGGTAVCGNTTMAAALGAFNGLFGTALGDTANIFYTRSDGSFTKAVPEPATLGLMGLGLLGMGFAARRRKST